jgi:predicted DNA repair protein MutK
MIGGVYLAFEGVEKIYEYFFHKGIKEQGTNVAQLTSEDAAAHEKSKIKSAILVDFILSVEIVIIALGTVAEQPMKIQIIVVTIVALLATVGVYGLVAVLVRMDDFGYRLMALGKDKSKVLETVGHGLVKSLPVLVRALAVIGTLAMILVGGGIFVHNWHFLHDLVHDMPAILGELLVGLAVGMVAVVLYKLGKSVFKK